MSAMTKSARGTCVTRNRTAEPGGSTQLTGHSRLAHGIGALLTLLLLAPAAAVLTAAIHSLLQLEGSGAPGCSGLDTLGPVLQAGVPAVLLLLAVPGALLSLGHRARGWIWLTLALLATVAVEVGVRVWLPACV